jgi:hypothetical protein
MRTADRQANTFRLTGMIKKTGSDKKQSEFAEWFFQQTHNIGRAGKRRQKVRFCRFFLLDHAGVRMV